MSTMYDALKKAEAERKKSASLNAPATDNAEVKNSAGIPESFKVILLVVAIIVVLGVAFYRFNEAKKKSMLKSQKDKKIDLPTTNLKPLDGKLQRAPGTYGVDGIIELGEGSMAVINGKLLRIDQSIDHLTLKKISSKEVELLNTKDNTIVVLKIK